MRRRCERVQATSKTLHSVGKQGDNKETGRMNVYINMAKVRQGFELVDLKINVMNPVTEICSTNPRLGMGRKEVLRQIQPLTGPN